MPPSPPRKKASSKDAAADQGDAVRGILVEAARTQLAAVTAATTFWAGWAEVAHKYALAVSDEVAKLDDPAAETDELLGRISDLTREYLRDIADLPTASVQHFNSRLEQIGRASKRPARAARVKV